MILKRLEENEIINLFKELDNLNYSDCKDVIRKSNTIKLLDSCETKALQKVIKEAVDKIGGGDYLFSHGELVVIDIFINE